MLKLMAHRISLGLLSFNVDDKSYLEINHTANIVEKLRQFDNFVFAVFKVTCDFEASGDV